MTCESCGGKHLDRVTTCDTVEVWGGRIGVL